MAAAAPKPKDNTQLGQPLWFTGYAGGDLFGSKPTLLKNRFLYVIAKQSNQPAKLHMELRPLSDGDEIYAGPPDRRMRERDLHNRDMFPVMSPIPWTIQGKGIKYFFFASPTRLLKRAIAALEFASVTFPDDWIDLSQPPDRHFFVHSGRPPVLLVIDPLTIATKLHSDYVEALYNQLSYTMPPDKTKTKEANKIRSRVLKYELAQLMNHYLLPDGRDPFHVRKELADMSGDSMRRYIQDFEATKKSLDDQVDGTAARLIDYLQSPHWLLLEGLHTYCKEDTAAWLEFIGPCIEGLASSERGMKFAGELYSRPRSWMAAAGITGAPLAPEGETMEHAETLTFIARKAAAGISAVWAEVLPAAIALGKTSVADALDRMDKVYRTILHRHVSFRYLLTPYREEVQWSVQQWLTRKPVDMSHVHKEISGFKDWTEEGKPMWPEESAGARSARTIQNILRAVQLLNLALKLKDAFDPNKGTRFEAGCEVTIAILDTIESFEKVLEPQLKKVVPEKVAGASFKFAGSAAGAVHAFLLFHERSHAIKEGKRDLISGYNVGITVFGLEAVGGFMSGGGILAGENTLGLVLGAVGSALCVVSFAGAIVYTLWAEGKKRTAFQRFVNHSVFGLQDDPREEELWASGRSFSSWKKQPSGLLRQRETLTMLFGNFTMEGTDNYGVDIRLGATPPGMKLKVTFTHGDRQWQSSPSHHPDVVAHAVIDPYAKDKGDVVEHTDGDVIWNWKRTQEENKATTIHIGCRPQRALGELSTQYCNVDAQLVFESEESGHSSEESGHSEEVAIPPEKPVHYVTMEGGTPASHPVKSSLPEPD